MRMICWPRSVYLIVLALALSCAPVIEGADESIPAVSLDRLVRALNGRDLSILAPQLANDIQIGPLTGATAKQALGQIVSNYPRSILSYTFASEPARSDGTVVVRAMFHCTDGDREHCFRLAKDGAFLELGLLRDRQLFQPKGIQCPSESKLPFELRDGLILVTGTVDGTEGLLLLDTGTRGMTLNAAHFRASLPEADPVLHFSVQGSSVSRKRVHVGELRLGSLVYSNFDVSCQNLDGLVQILHRDLLGIIGFDQIAKFETLFDYSARKVTFFALDEAGKRVSKTPAASAAIEIPFVLVDHLPVVEGKLGTVTAAFAVDSGLSLNAITTPLRTNPAAGFKADTTLTVTPVFGVATPMESGRLASVQIGSTTYLGMPTVVTDLGPVGNSTGNRFSAILGGEFLGRDPISINYARNVISIWKRNPR